jgi:hypothetical protein
MNKAKVISEKKTSEKKQTSAIKKKLNKIALLQALEKSLGIVSSACKAVGISRETFYAYMKEDDVFNKQVKDLENVSLDFVESKLFKRIESGSDACTIFYLKTKGKNRGYVERIETINQIVENIDNKTEAELLKELDLLNNKIK